MFKKIIALKLALALTLSVAACGNTKQIDGVTYDVFGLANDAEKRNPAIEYEVSTGSVIMGMIFFETVVIPVYILCYDLYQPVGKMPAVKGVVAH